MSTSAARHLADDRPLEITTIRSARSRISSSSVEISSTADAVGRDVAQLRRHVLDGADVEARGSAGRRRARAGRATARGRARPVAGCRPESDHNGASGTGARDVELVDQPPRLLAHRAEPIRPAAGTRVEGSARKRFSATVKSSTQPESWRSSGITAMPARPSRRRRPVGDAAAVDLDRPASTRSRLDSTSPSAPGRCPRRRRRRRSRPRPTCNVEAVEQHRAVAADDRRMSATLSRRRPARPADGRPRRPAPRRPQQAEGRRLRRSDDRRGPTIARASCCGVGAGSCARADDPAVAQLGDLVAWPR